MSIIKKQLIMNEIRLPMDMINIIKEYCFTIIEEVTKRNKYKIHRIITSAESTRANCCNYMEDYSDDDPHWCFGVGISNEYKETLQIQALMCSDCGEYQMSSCSPAKMCECENNYDYDSDYDYDYDSDYDSDYDLDDY